MRRSFRKHASGHVANVSHANPLAVHRKGGFVEFIDDSVKSTGLYYKYAYVFRSRRVYWTILFSEFGPHDIPDEMLRLSIIHPGQCNRARTFRA